MITVLLLYVGAKSKTLLLETADTTSSTFNSKTSNDYGNTIDCQSPSR